MKRWIKKLIASGIWLAPICFTACTVLAQRYFPGSLNSVMGWIGCALISLFPVLAVYGNRVNRPDERTALTGLEKAQHPEVNGKLLNSKPEGIVFGAYGNRFVCKKLSEDGHVFLIGGSGSGKSSSVVIPTLLSNPKESIFALDIKGELSFKTVKAGDEHALVFNPADRTSYGYDPFYALDKDSTSQQVLEVMQNIAFSLIPMPAGIKDPFWKISARNLLIGFLIYFYKASHKDFIGILDLILHQPVQKSIKEIMEKAKSNSAEYRYIVQFSGMEDITLGGIVAEMNNHLVIFANDQDIRYAFGSNYCRWNPTMLNVGKSIFLSIREEKLSAYYDVLQLIINQTLMELEKRPEGSAPVIFIIDELARILSAGKLDRLLDAARTLRSRNVSLFLITQSIESLMGAYSESEVTDLISNCPYIMVLSATSSKTQKMVCDWCGKYMARKKSWSGEGVDTKPSVSYEEKEIVQPADLMTLQQTGEAILISPYGYSRIRKTPYYSDEHFRPLSEEIATYNQHIFNKEK